ncbi:MAG: ASPIC/UnbV domain-containing protein [Planctomycetota bacterium]|nr:ASPIC/UnbV domain-containing protein [Planctomycetota bacterium]MDP6761485.1 ASPIC/UnbV domain-containing protein [Planctomycetota bacterium]MDP6989447.1 ASPIC/UnbV domain-containing protein [Planctomycetota bacterium]
MNADVDIEGSFSGYQRDRVFYNPDGPAERRYFEAGWLFGLDGEHDGRCTVPVDVDGDGDLDLALLSLQGLRLFENRAAPARFARLRLMSGRSFAGALGAIVRLTAAGMTHSDHAKVLDGFQSQVPTDLHFGLGEADDVERVRVEWPSGAVEVWEDLPADRLIVLTEGESEARVEELPRWPGVARARREATAEQAWAAWSPDDDGAAAAVVRWVRAPKAGEPLTVPEDLAALAREFPEVSWTLVMPAGTEPAACERARETAPVGFAFVLADERTRALTFGHSQVAVPDSTFVLRGGSLRRAFYRPTKPEELAPLLASLRDEDPYPQLLVWTARRRLEADLFEESLALFEEAAALDGSLATAHEGAGRALLGLGRTAEAEAAYLAAVAADGDYAPGHVNLGIVRTQAGRFAEALAPLWEALRIQGEYAPTLLAFGEAAVHAGRPTEALDAFLRAARSEPENTAAHLLAGKLLGQLGRYDQACESLQRAVELDPENEEARKALELSTRLAAGDG